MLIAGERSMFTSLTAKAPAYQKFKLCDCQKLFPEMLGVIC